MHSLVQARIEGPRGCGYRRSGGVYLVTDLEDTMPCGKLPIPLCPCERCGRGIKPTRGWQWVRPAVILADAGTPGHYRCNGGHRCDRCPLFNPNGHSTALKVGLLWAGESFYPTPLDWMKEAMALGASRRIKTLPKGFVLGQTWVWMAHRKALVEKVRYGDVEMTPADPKYTPGVFHAFRPTRIEVVVDVETPDEAIEAMAERGFTPVAIEKRTNWAHRGVTEDFSR